MLAGGSSILDAPRPGSFATTHWSVVLSARDGAAPERREALESLCRAYWYPLYGYVRRRGYEAHDAQDLTQEFFCRLLEKNYLARVDPSKGKFRSFLLVAMHHFLANEWDRARAIKRGGRYLLVPFEEGAEERYQGEAGAAGSPEREFERQWALALLERALGRLRLEFVRTDRLDRFEALKGFLTGDRPSVPYAEAALRMGLSEGALKMAVQRLRRRYGELLREEIAGTVARPEDIEEELRFLIAAVRA